MQYDLDLRAIDIQPLSDLNGIAAFFASLGYEVSRLPQTLDTLNINSATFRGGAVKGIERIVSYEAEFEVYVVELKSVTVTNTQGLVRAFRDLAGDFLLVLTDDYNRIDFVLIERLRAENSSIRKGGLSVRPLVLTVDRRSPSPQALRVLRRFSFTEPDVLAQYDKLRSAYTVAEWSAIYYNNRALFSDYYLNERLRETPIWKAVAEQISTTFRAAQPHLVGVRQRLGGKDEQAAIDRLYMPLLTQLGFHAVPGKVGETAHLTEPDFRLYASASDGDSDRDKPLALLLTYPLNRNLDSTDLARDAAAPNEVPGAKVVTLLDAGEADWAIVTNGKLWRLYSTKAHSRATNYYEVDLEEALSGESALDGQDRGLAFLYWWLFFRSEAFMLHDSVLDDKPRRVSFLDEVSEGSENYAKALGERLKNRVFEDIFPHFSQGFVVAMKRASKQAPSDAEPVLRGYSEADLNLVFHATLTLLYRLMFLLYAESRSLLPIQEARGYSEISLKQLKEEIATAAGTISDEAITNLRRQYSTHQTTLYTRLQTLFRAIDQGDALFNMPQYNGGLFITHPDDIATMPHGIEKQVAQFLLDAQVPDQYIALGLDFLSRDFDFKTKTLAAIDFKSLGVRQLGSIYEGLLEFKLMVAQEKMAVVTDSGVEKIVPYADAVKQNLRIKTIPHSYYRERFYAAKGTHPGEIVYATGNVYLINTKQERKATGSYYTPDYIVQYIVQHTVGPVLDAKFEALTPRLRVAGKLYHDARKRAEGFKKSDMTGDDPEKVWNDVEMQALAHDVFDLKVLDPAMGSGHFLVEVVDYVTDRIIKFLQGHPTNPVAAMLRRTRADILDNLTSNNISIDPARLTDVALLKRQVLKRCVYGVDLNPMAVELAKVSLWLDAFTLGAPLSFLDHHLKCGNSLIGARIADVQAALDKPDQRSLLAQSQFTGLMLATDLMARIGDLPDVTIEQNRKSKSTYADAYAALAPFKRILDMYTSRWFGNTPTKAKGKNRQMFDPTLEFLSRDDTQAWITDPTSATLAKDDYMKAAQVAETTMTVAKGMRFFHWELEFPEVFFAASSMGLPGRTRQDAGFDAVVGNPPYDVMEKAVGELRLANLAAFVDYLNLAPIYQPALGGKPNIFRFFVILWVALIQPHGEFGLIIPLSIATDLGCANLRRWLLTEHSLHQIDAFPDRYNPNERVFQEAKTSVAILRGTYRAEAENSVTIFTRSGAKFDTSAHRVVANAQAINDVDPVGFTFPTSSQEIWNVVKKVHQSSNIARLHDISEIGAGEIHLTYFKPYFTSYASDCEVIRGAEIQRYRISEYLKQGEKLYLDLDAARKGKLNPQVFKKPRIGLQRLTGTEDLFRILPAIVQPGIQLAHTTQYVASNSEYHINYLLGVLASKFIDQRFRVTSGTTNVGVYELEQLPIRRIDFTTPTQRRAELVAQAHDLYAGSQAAGHADVLVFVADRLAAGETDVIHDLLAFLAQQMIDLNKQKQAEIKRFLTWLEGIVRITPGGGKSGWDVIAGKTDILDYLGDYQKGEPEKSFQQIMDRLIQNRTKLGMNLSDTNLVARLTAEYAHSLASLRPTKAQLAATDALIDQVVYQLYGLTDDEIRIVEGKS